MYRVFFITMYLVIGLRNSADVVGFVFDNKLVLFLCSPTVFCSIFACDKANIYDNVK